LYYVYQALQNSGFTILVEIMTRGFIHWSCLVDYPNIQCSRKQITLVILLMLRGHLSRHLLLKVPGMIGFNEPISTLMWILGWDDYTFDAKQLHRERESQSTRHYSL